MKSGLKHRILIVFVLVASLAGISTTKAASDPVNIHPWRNQEHTIATKDEIIIEWTWFACSRGLTQSFVDALTPGLMEASHTENGEEPYHEYWLIAESDGEETMLFDTKKSNSMLGPVVEDGIVEPIPDYECYYPAHRGFKAPFSSRAFKLKVPPGDYTLEIRLSFSEWVLDGGRYIPDAPNVSTIGGDIVRTTIIHVTE